MSWDQDVADLRRQAAEEALRRAEADAADERARRATEERQAAEQRQRDKQADDDQRRNLDDLRQQGERSRRTMDTAGLAMTAGPVSMFVVLGIAVGLAAQIHRLLGGWSWLLGPGGLPEANLGAAVIVIGMDLVLAVVAITWTVMLALKVLELAFAGTALVAGKTIELMLLSTAWLLGRTLRILWETPFGLARAARRLAHGRNRHD